MRAGLDAVRLGVLGGGNMGGAIIRGVVRAELLPPGRITVFDIDAARTRALRTECAIAVAESPAVLAEAADVLLVAVKPQGVVAAVEALAPHVNIERHCVVSIVAGVPIAALAARLPAGARLVRVMPNTPALVGLGMTAISPGPTASKADAATVEALFATLGAVVHIDECHMDAITAVSGSGPAYVFLAAECLAAAAVDAGLPEGIVDTVVQQTLLGAATLLAQADEPASVLRERVTSPGGTTEAALGVFAAHDVRAVWSEAVAAATRRGAELAKLV